MFPPIHHSIEIAASPARVWHCLTTPACIREWMGGDAYQVEVQADWQVGGTIRIDGFHIARFENRGTVLDIVPERLLQYDLLSSLSHLPDIPENRTQFLFSLMPQGDQTILNLQIAQFPTETIYFHLEFYWHATINLLKETVEREMA